MHNHPPTAASTPTYVLTVTLFMGVVGFLMGGQIYPMRLRVRAPLACRVRSVPDALSYDALSPPCEEWIPSRVYVCTCPVWNVITHNERMSIPGR